ncbi:UDP-N-acetylglucosamine 2-epimerase (hydrolyzing) [bacterium]|nr:UDP-N-acetylglucosamine 2-epimerase (hydrolyzing) [candidate division CSSED10-310 bacterium]
MDQKRILFLTASRADYGKMKPLMKAVEVHPDLNCSIAVTGMHLVPHYGLTAAQIFRDGFSDIHPFTNQNPGKTGRRDHIVADTIRGLSSILEKVQPDMLVIHGDRPETLAGAIAGSFNLVLTAHMEGGEISGTIDEIIRHAVTKLAHIHFASTNDAQRRLLQLGEIEGSIHVIGSPDIDIMLSDGLPCLDEVKDHYNIPFSSYIILVYHPVAFERDNLRDRVRMIMDVIASSGRSCVAIYPNNEPGADDIIDAYKHYHDASWFRCLPSMRFEFFLTLLRHADGIVGNSSCGIHEAPVFGVPTINLGTRQRNRFSYAGIANIGENPDQLGNALTGLKHCEKIKTLHFGDGSSCSRFISVLTKGEVWKTPVEKQFRDLAIWSRNE